MINRLKKANFKILRLFKKQFIRFIKSIKIINSHIKYYKKHPDQDHKRKSVHKKL
jgi:hypothetical protein